MYEHFVKSIRRIPTVSNHVNRICFQKALRIKSSKNKQFHSINTCFMHRINKESNACCVLKCKKKIELKRVHIVNDCNIQTVLACVIIGIPFYYGYQDMSI